MGTAPGLTTGSECEKLRTTLIEQIVLKAASLITVDAVAKIHGAASPDVARKSAAGIRDELSKFIYAELLVPMSGVLRRGRLRQFAVRDREIYQKHRSGSSYGKISCQLKISRNAVQAAFRRERKRRERLCRDYPKFRQSLEALGIILEQAKA